MGRAKVHPIVSDHTLERDRKYGNFGTTDNSGSPARDSTYRNIFLPINHNDGSNPEIEVEPTDFGVPIYRFSEGFNYPHANHYLHYLVSTIYREARRTNPDSYPRLGERPWNDPGP